LLDDVLSTLRFGRIERPPILWNPASDDDNVRLLLEAMSRASGRTASDLVLNISNIVIDRDGEDQRVPAREFVALTIKGTGTWAEDQLWVSGERRPGGVLGQIHVALTATSARAAYSRQLGEESSMTVMLTLA